MTTQKRATVYLDSELHQALRMKSAAMGRSISEVVNAAVSRALLEDAEDLEALESRKRERSLDFETLVKDLRRRGKI